MGGTLSRVKVVVVCWRGLQKKQCDGLGDFQREREREREIVCVCVGFWLPLVMATINLE